MQAPAVGMERCRVEIRDKGQWGPDTERQTDAESSCGVGGMQEAEMKECGDQRQRDRGIHMER